MTIPPFVFRTFLITVSLVSVSTHTISAGENSENTRRTTLNNTTAYIPSQCYTKTEAAGGKIQNPCYVCHTKSVQPNYTNDQDLQLNYSFPESGQTNPWKNLFEDRSQRIAAISDAEILAYIEKNNYLAEDGSIILAEKLKNLPKNWDYNNNNQWDGYQPDCYFSFDAEGFDKDPHGSFSGWRAFGYHPLPSTFWPTNGSTDDVMLRLPESFRQTENGTFDLETYKVNLAIIEALISRRDVYIDAVDEVKWQVDLDQDGTLGRTDTIRYHWPEKTGEAMRYVGLAGLELQAGKRHLAAGLFPVGTEFLHSVRYLGFSDQDKIVPASKMKELRYMKKRTWQTYADLEELALSEMKERDDFPDRVSQFIGNAEQGVNNGSGWVLQGFIEDQDGELRPQNYEETVYCAGCHGGIGATTDSVFAFPRKLASTAESNSWFHWNDKYLDDIKEPKTVLHRAGTFYEYSYYLMYNQEGSELRNNDEIKDKFTNKDHSLNYNELQKIQNDVSHLLIPSRKRALALNKAYRTIVIDQDFVDGRDANIDPVENVHQKTETDQSTDVEVPTSPVMFANTFGEDNFNTSLLENQDKERKAEIFGHSMSGPDGLSYGAQIDGTIHKSSYYGSAKDAQMLFPDRLTLPTRNIIATAGVPGCSVCHRNVRGSIDDRAKNTASTILTAKGNNSNASYSPDGKYIAFVSDRSGKDELWLMNSDGSEQRQISTGPAQHSWPDWKANSQQLVYLAHDNSHEYIIKTFDLKTKKEYCRVVSRQKLARPVFYPDPKVDRIAYAALDGENWDLWLLDEHYKEHRLTRSEDMETNPLWSPDGSMLAYKVAPADAKYGLTVENFLTFENGYTAPTLHKWQGVESVQMNDWSPDSKRISYTAEVISGSSGEERVTYMGMVSDLSLYEDKAQTSASKFLSGGFTLGDRGPLFSPDGEKIVFWGWNKDLHAGLWLYDFAKNRTTALEVPGNAMYPKWSPDGKAIVYESRFGEQTQLAKLDLSAGFVQPAKKLAVR
jgi:Tol biopolymer transport system component